MSYVQTISFDTLYFANKLKAARVEPKIAETEAKLQAEIQSNMRTEIKAEMQTKVLDKLVEHEDILYEITKHELVTKAYLKATKDDLHKEINRLDHKIDCLEHRIDKKLEALKNDLILKLGKIMTSGITIAVTILGVIITSLGVLVTVLH